MKQKLPDADKWSLSGLRPAAQGNTTVVLAGRALTFKLTTIGDINTETMRMTTTFVCKWAVKLPSPWHIPWKNKASEYARLLRG